KKYGEEIVNFLDVEYILMQHYTDLDKEILYQVIKRERNEISMFLLKQKLQEINIFNKLRLNELIQTLLQEGYIVYTSHGIKYNNPSVLQYIKYNKETYPYTFERMQCKTLEEIGTEEGDTSDRDLKKLSNITEY